MQNSVSIPFFQKNNSFKINVRFLLFSLILMCFFALFVYFTSLIFVKSALEEVIDDELVWQEVKDLPVDAALLMKLIAEIEGIKRKERTGEFCEQYVLYASKSGFYPCFHSEKRVIYLKTGEIWKIGKTCLSIQDRYPSGLPVDDLLYFPQFRGTAKQCLLVEKVRLYSYVSLSENLKRKYPLILPPGNKIYR
jgi:hypothetical protein